MKHFSPNFIFVDSNLISLRSEQLQKHCDGMKVNVDGRTTISKLAQLKKHFSPYEIIFEGMITLLN